ncbi:L2 [Macaca mulatta papillomavirus 5]|uniref:L2 n=1 Tax=Macaca mulatta papillomavirus 5 TaxID=2364645 RepID=UPI000EB623DE|nr:L2 [Macaca mulatta papillomavirus 5]AYD74603.1 L2 [Macaca mulatta papillomavirus 5]
MSTRPRKRTKRDSVTNLYNQCQLSGNCPDDVKNKVEGTTVADWLLKVFSSIVYFGGLGIGTGRGSGGSTGYRPLGAGTGGGGRVTTDGTVIKPSIPVDPLGPAQIVPVDPISPGSSSIVPLLEGGPDVTFELQPEIIPGIDTTGNVGVTTEPDIIEIGSSGGTPTVSTVDDTAAVLDVQPTTSTPSRTRISTSKFGNPSYISIVTESSSAADTAPTPNIFIDGAVGGEFVGEEIPLDTFNEPLEFEIEGGSAPKTSTPVEGFTRTLQRARELYNKRVRQVMTRNENFLARAPQAVQFQFENPAFDNDVTLTFQQDLDQLAAAAPDSDFADIIKLSRPAYSETNEGYVRYSRLGQRGTIRTRAGTQIGERVHFYYDLSSIDNAEAIELSVLGEHSGDASIIDPLSESILVDAENTNDPFIFPEEELIDDLTEDFSNSHIVLSSGTRRGVLNIPTLPPGVALRMFIPDIGEGLFVAHPHGRELPAYEVPSATDMPSILIDGFSSTDFVLHPSLQRKRKRKRNEGFFL